MNEPPSEDQHDNSSPEARTDRRFEAGVKSASHKTRQAKRLKKKSEGLAATDQRTADALHAHAAAMAREASSYTKLADRNAHYGAVRAEHERIYGSTMHPAHQALSPVEQADALINAGRNADAACRINYIRHLNPLRQSTSPRAFVLFMANEWSVPADEVDELCRLAANIEPNCELDFVCTPLGSLEEMGRLAQRRSVDQKKYAERVGKIKTQLIELGDQIAADSGLPPQRGLERAELRALDSLDVNTEGNRDYLASLPLGQALIWIAERQHERAIPRNSLN